MGSEMLQTCADCICDFLEAFKKVNPEKRNLLKKYIGTFPDGRVPINNNIVYINKIN